MFHCFLWLFQKIYLSDGINHIHDEAIYDDSPIVIAAFIPNTAGLTKCCYESILSVVSSSRERWPTDKWHKFISIGISIYFQRYIFLRVLNFANFKLTLSPRKMTHFDIREINTSEISWNFSKKKLCHMLTSSRLVALDLYTVELYSVNNLELKRGSCLRKIVKRELWIHFFTSLVSMLSSFNFNQQSFVSSLNELQFQICLLNS